MAGLIRPESAKALVEGLQKIYSRVAQPAENAKELGAIGRAYLESAERNPDNYFRTSKELPSTGDRHTDAEFLNKKYELAGDDKVRFRGQFGAMENGRGAELRQSANVNLGNTEGLEGVLKPGLMKRPRAGMNPGTEAWGADTMALNPGDNANKFYDAAYDYMLSRDAANYSGGLSSANSFRRTANMVPKYEKYGEQANRLIMDPDQLRAIGLGYGAKDPNSHIVSNFHRLPLDAQIGTMNGIIAQKSGDEVQRLLRHVLATSQGADRGSFLSASANKLLGDIKGLKLDPEGPWTPSTDVDEEQLKGLADLLQRIPKEVPSTFSTVRPSAVGYDSLRRAAIAHDASEYGLGAADFASQPWLTRGLGRASGGRVPANPPRQEPPPAQALGPLTRLWQ